jgi:acyl-CoA thioester hydrolase
VPKSFSVPIDIRFSDIDIYAHVNSVIYFSYMETARVKMFRDAYKELTEQGILLLVGRAECDYRTPILFDDRVVVTVWVSRIGTTSFDLDYRIHDDGGKVFATGRTSMVCFDKVANAATPVPERLKELG